METTRLSSKGQIIIPKSVRSANRWEEGAEFAVIDTGEGILLKPKALFARTRHRDVSGLLRNRVKPRTDAQIRAALTADIRKKWRGGN